MPPEVADRILHMRGDGMSYRAIAERLNADEVPTARGAKEWHFTTVRSAEKSRKLELAAQAA